MRNSSKSNQNKEERHLRLVAHCLLEVALGEELGVDELGRVLGVGPVLRLLAPITQSVARLGGCENPPGIVPIPVRESVLRFEKLEVTS